MKKGTIALLAAAIATLAVSGWAGAGESAKDGGDIIYNKPVRAVIFSHEAHVDKKGLSCDLCHSTFFEMQARKVQEQSDFNMEGLAQGKYCGACHNGTMAFSSNTRCATCHCGVKGSPGVE